LVALGLELRASLLLGRYCIAWATLSALSCVEYFWDRVSQTICLGWLQTVILFISASWVARITGMSQWHSALNFPHLWGWRTWDSEVGHIFQPGGEGEVWPGEASRRRWLQCCSTPVIAHILRDVHSSSSQNRV
jgi:hypothetical protein